MRTLLRAQGRLVLDLYNAAFFRLNQGTHIFKRNGRDITETKRVDGNRLHVKLCYRPSEETDQFDWQIYDLDELCGLAEEVGFALMLACTSFDARVAPSSAMPRMQFVFEKR